MTDLISSIKSLPIYKTVSQTLERLEDDGNEKRARDDAVVDVMEEAVGDADDRIDLIFKADTEPKYGWKAITALDEKKKLSSKDPEKDKAFAACLKKVQDADKKATKSHSQSQGRSFRGAPGGNPGYSSSGRDTTAKNCQSEISSLVTFFLFYTP